MPVIVAALPEKETAVRPLRVEDEPMTFLTPSRVFSFVLVLLTSVTAVAANQASATDIPIVKYDHLNDGATAAYSISIAPNKAFIVEIEHTYPPGYDYEIAGIPLRTEEQGFGFTGEVQESELETKQLTQTHDAKFGGYVVRITHKDEPTDVVLSNNTKKKLPDATLVISVKTLGFDYEMAGAFTATGLTDPVFAVHKTTENGQDRQTIFRDRAAEDRNHLGMGALIHTYNTRWPYIAGTFGIGINQGNRVTYYAGPSLKVGKAYLTAGIAAGSVNRLPAGLAVGDLLTDTNALANGGTRVSRSWFVGFSYTFLNPGDALQKPFAGAESKTSVPASDSGRTQNNNQDNNNFKPGNTQPQPGNTQPQPGNPQPEPNR
jgi:hypothetical protein